jgi:hypothetical protein
MNNLQLRLPSGEGIEWNGPFNGTVEPGDWNLGLDRITAGPETTVEVVALRSSTRDAATASVVARARVVGDQIDETSRRTRVPRLRLRNEWIGLQIRVVLRAKP